MYNVENIVCNILLKIKDLNMGKWINNKNRQIINEEICMVNEIYSKIFHLFSKQNSN